MSGTRSVGRALAAILAVGGTVGAGGGDVPVRVVDPAGRPVAESRVAATCPGSLRVVVPAASQGEGSAAGGAAAAPAPGLHRLRLPAGPCDLWAGAEGWGFGWSGGGEGGPAPVAVDAEATDGSGHAVALGPGGTLTLELVGPRGAPVDGRDLERRVRWRRHSADAWREVPPAVLGWADGGAEGWLRISGLAPGWYEVELRAPLYGVPAIGPLEVPAGEVRRLRVELRPAAEVCGFVVTHDLAFDGGFVRWWRTGGEGRGAVELAADGSFCVGGLEAGERIGLTAIRHGIESEPVYAAAPAGAVAVELAPAAVARGRVLRDGEPPVPGSVELAVHLDLPQVGAGELPALHRQRLEDPDGAFAVGLMPGVEVRLVFRSDGVAPAVVRLDGREPPHDLVVELAPGTVLRGLVRSALTGDPLAAARVVAECRREGTGDERRTAATGDDGVYELEPLAAGACRVTAEHPEHAPAGEDVDVRGEQAELTVDLVLEPEAAVAGVVVAGEPPHPVAGAAVRVRPVERAAGERTARTDAEGRFRVGGLAPAAHRVEVRHPRDGVATQVVRAVRGESPGATIRLVSTLVVTGEVRGPDGPAADATVLLHAQPRSLRGRTGADGRFRFEDVPEGRLSLDASIDRGRTWCPASAEARGPGPHHVVIECGGGFEVRVIDPAGRLAGSQVHLEREQGGLFAPERRDGAVSWFLGVLPGDYALVASRGMERRTIWRGPLHGPGEVVVPPG